MKKYLNNLYMSFLGNSDRNSRAFETIKTYSIRLRPNQDLKIELQKFVEDQNIQAAVILSAVGSLKKVSLRFANQKSSMSFAGYHEVVSLCGTLAVAGMHLHMSVCDDKGQTIGGHLVEDNIVYTTMEIVILEQTEFKFSREIDPESGFRELFINQR